MHYRDWVIQIRTEIVIVGNVIGWQLGKLLRKKLKKGKK